MSRGYDRLAWVDYPAELTPISAENLNRIEEGIENLYTDRDHMEGNLAVVDDNERASRDYDINTYIMHNGIFYKVILDIQENEEFNDEAGGNIRPVSVSSQLGSGGGGSTGCVELTQAEYDALPEEDKMADVIYLITDTPNNFLDEVFGDFASVEYTNKASKAYAVGEYLMLDSKLYRVTAAISQNDTIAVGTNVVATTVGSEFNAVEDRLHNVLGNYAEVEPEAVASKIYAAGDFLILNDYLYKTTSAIATGEDLIEGTNIDKTTVGAELDTSPRFTIYSATTTSTGGGACTCYWAIKEYDNKHVELHGRFSLTKNSYASFSTMFWAYYVDLKLPITLSASGTRVTSAWTIGNGFSVPSGVSGDLTTNVRVSALASENGSSTAKSCTGYVHIYGYRP